MKTVIACVSMCAREHMCECVCVSVYVCMTLHVTVLVCDSKCAQQYERM